MDAMPTNPRTLSSACASAVGLLTAIVQLFIGISDRHVYITSLTGMYLIWGVGHVVAMYPWRPEVRPLETRVIWTFLRLSEILMILTIFPATDQRIPCWPTNTIIFLCESFLWVMVLMEGDGDDDDVSIMRMIVRPFELITHSFASMIRLQVTALRVPLRNSRATKAADHSRAADEASQPLYTELSAYEDNNSTHERVESLGKTSVELKD